MTLGNSTCEQIAQEIDDLLKSPGLDGEDSPWVDVKLAYGIRAYRQHHSWYTVTWVPVGGEVTMSTYVGGRPRVDGKSAQQIRSATMIHDIFIVGEKFEDTEALWKALVASIAMSTGGSLDLGEFEWMTETTATDETVHGTIIRQRVSLDIPIHTTDRTKVELLYQMHTGTFQGRTGDEDVCT